MTSNLSTENITHENLSLAQEKVISFNKSHKNQLSNAIDIIKLLHKSIEIINTKDRYNTNNIKGLKNSQNASDHKEMLDKRDSFRILIAEDEEINYILMREILSSLENLKIEILHAQNGQEAVDICRFTNNIDLVFMDIKMPVLDGLDATRYIKDMNASIPIIAQSAYTSDADKKIAYETGCNEYLSKPIDTDKLTDITLKYLNIKN